MRQEWGLQQNTVSACDTKWVEGEGMWEFGGCGGNRMDEGRIEEFPSAVGGGGE